MKDIKNSVKHWQDLQKTFHFTTGYLHENIKIMELDMEDMARTQPYLFECFVSIFSGKANDESYQLWENYKKAYQELHEKSLLNFKNTKDDFIKKTIDEFIQKANGPHLLTLDDLEDVITEKKHKKQTTVQVEFNQYMDLIEEAYDFDYRNFFSKFSENKMDFSRLLKITTEDYHKYSRISPVEHLISAKICIITEHYDFVNSMPYVDFWHHLLDHDFSEVQNGSIQYMSSDFKAQDIKNKGTVVPAIVFNTFRQIVFKEISQLPYYKEKSFDQIEFYIYW